MALAETGIPALERGADALERAMESARVAFSGMPVLAAHGPGRPELEAILRSTSTLASALAALLDALDRALGNEGAEPWLPLLSPASVRDFLSLRFPTPKTGGDSRTDHTGPPRGFGLLGAFYGAVSELDNALWQQQVPKSHVWRATVDLWTTIVYLGGTHAGGGLPSRLDRIALLPGRRSSPRGSIDYPWDRADIAGLNETARRCDFLVTAGDAEIDEAACQSWCDLSDGWLTLQPDAVPAAEPMLTAHVSEAPALEPRVLERLRRIAALPGLPTALRSKVLARIAAPPNAPIVLDARYSRAAFLSSPDARGLADELAAVLAHRLRANATQEEEAAIMAELRALGHPLYSFDDFGHGGIWCDDWSTRRAEGSMVVTLSYGTTLEGVTGATVDVAFRRE